MGRNELLIKLHHPIIELAANIPSNDNLILMGNHPNKLDPLLISGICPDVSFVKDVDERLCLPIKTIDCNLKNNNMSYLSNVYIALLEKQVLCIFPEGEINRDDELKPFLKGAMTLPIRSKSKIMPFYINGNYNLFSRTPLIIRIGEPFIPENMKENELEQCLKEKIYELKKK